MTDVERHSQGQSAARVSAQGASEADPLESDRFHLAAIVENSDDAIVSKTLNGIVKTWNAGAERLFGWTAAEMIGHPIHRVVPAELQHEEQRMLDTIRRGERVERFETERLRKDGERVAVSVTISPVRDRSGNVIGASKIAHYITRRREVDQALRDEAHALETLDRVGRVVAAQLDLTNAVQVVTDAARDLSGAQFGAFFYNVADQGQDAYWLYTLSGADRESFARFPMPRSTNVFAPTFEGTGIVRSGDIRKDPRYGRNAPYNGMPPGHLPVCSYLAVPVISASKEVIGGLFFGHAQPDVFGEREEKIVAGIASQAAIAIDNARLFKTFRDNEQQLAKVAEELRQVLESERLARSQAEHLSHMKDEFLATLSHELRTPLNSILNWATLLQQPKLTADDQRRGAQIIERNARVQAKIVDDLLDMSRIISGKIHLEVQPLQLHDVINNAIETVRQSAAAKRIRITTLLDSSIGLVRGDANRLQQVLWNLLSNAVKFTPNDGKVHIILERVNSHVEIVVEDTGVGINREFLPYVFDRFRQADPSTTRHHGGLGLGLSIVKSLVELHGGSVRVKSAGESMGSTFVVALPVAHVRSDDVNAATGRMLAFDSLESVELPDLAGISVLIVDDEPDGRTVIARIVEGRGASATCAASAAEALQYLSVKAFDVLLSDIGMPHMDGNELIRRVRTLDSQRSRPMTAIAITAYARPEDRQRSLLAGYQMHLSKPIEARELIAGIASLLHLKRS